MTYSLEWKDRMCIVRFSGTADDKEISQCDEIVDGHQNFDQLLYSIWDFSDVEQFDLTVEACVQIAAKDIAAAKTNPRIKLAIVVNQEDQEALAYLYESEALQLPWKVKVFSTFSEAMAWSSQP